LSTIVISIPDFASITSPLIDLYKGGKPGVEKINWTPEAEEAFTSMKEKLTSAPTLGLGPMDDCSFICGPG